MAEASDEPYVARFGFGVKTVLVLLFAAVAVVGTAALDPGREMPDALFLWLWKILVFVLFGGGGLVLLLAGLSRRIALRVDREGVTLGSPPRLVPWTGPTVSVPWRAIRTVALFHQYGRWPARMLFVGLELGPAASVPEGTPRPGSFMHRSYSGLIPHVPVEISTVSRPVNGWRLSRRRLVTAVSAFAPAVPVIEFDRDGSQRVLSPAPGDN
jgi:hypothetical protein